MFTRRLIAPDALSNSVSAIKEDQKANLLHAPSKGPPFAEEQRFERRRRTSNGPRPSSCDSSFSSQLYVAGVIGKDSLGEEGGQETG